MNIEGILNSLHNRGISLALRDGRIAVKSKEGALDCDTRDLIISRKSEFVEFLGRYYGVTASVSVIQPRSPETVIPLSLVQQSYWFLYQLENRGTTYNIPTVLSVSGQVDIAALERSFVALVTRHEVLRTRVEQGSEGAYQVIDPVPSDVLVLKQVKNLSETELQEVIKHDISQPFYLESQGAFRAILYCVNDRDYVLSMAAHHIVMDGWSLGLLFNELAALYGAFHHDLPSPLHELPIQYGDYAVWQATHVRGDIYDEQCEFWQENLSGLSPLLNLPADFPRPPVQSYRGGRVPIEIPLALSQRLSDFGRSQGATLYHVLLGGLAVLLSRYSGTSDIPIGTAYANRPQKELESLIGCFANTIVLRCRADGDQSFGQLVQSVRDTALEAFAHSDISFDGVVELVKPERSLGVPPIFQVMFRLHNQDTGEGVTVDAVEFSPYPLGDRSQVELDLNISLFESDDGVRGEFAFATDLFRTETVSRFITHYLHLLTMMVESSCQPVSIFPLLLESERQQLDQWNQTHIAYPELECIHTLFEQASARLPDKEAYVCGTQRYSYAQLNAEANTLAHWLRAQGVGPEVRVGVSVGRNTWMGIALLAVLKSGGTYVPLDPDYPTVRLQHMLEVAEPTIILTEERYQEKFSDIASQIVCLDIDKGLWSKELITNPVPLPTSEHSAYILFTSGTTGKPKGILVTHKSWRNMAVAHSERGLSGEDKRVLQFSSLSFAVSLWNTLMAWSQGGTLCQVTKQEAMPGEGLYQLLAREKINLVTLPASLLSIFPIEKIPSSLNIVISTAEACSNDIVSNWTQTGIRFFNMYGNSEVSMGSTLYEYTSTNQKLSIGTPLPNTQMYLLDTHMQVVPPGVVGEIYTGGVGLAKCYVNQPEETQAKFIDNPFDKRTSSRLYKTGDLGRYLPNGEIEYVGRDDFQVNIRGFRIELLEIESVLKSRNNLSEVAVVARPDATGMDQLVCFYVRAPDWDVDESLLRAMLLERLPSYMVPMVFVELEMMPLTPNRKLDRLALPTPKALHVNQGEYVAPETTLECQIAEVWETLLGVERIGLNDSFFDLGGHSLLVVSMVAEINTVTNKKFRVTDVFQMPSINGIITIQNNRNIHLEKYQSIKFIAGSEQELNSIYIVPGMGGAIFNLFGLGFGLSSAATVYGMQSLGYKPDEEPFETVEEAASFYAKEIMEKQPEGMCYLVGHSFGGWVVYEMSRILEEFGRGVKVVLIDSPAPKKHGALSMFSNKIKTTNSILNEFFGSMSEEESESLGGHDFELSFRQIAELQSRVQFYPGKTKSVSGVMHVKAMTKHGVHFSSRQCDWSEFFSREIVYKEVNGSHFSVMDAENAGELSNKIKEYFGF